MKLGLVVVASYQLNSSLVIVKNLETTMFFFYFFNAFSYGL